ncbi:MAG: hypothetical protein HKO96_05050, partial [Flavobacteriaceae bacterium]|nr:hypothetical protein [Flavobacteriaceae bacterium]
MKTKLLFGLLLLLGMSAKAQTCNSNTFNSPGAPSSCTYTYTSSGWENASGTPIAAPQSIDVGESVCILADNSDLIGSDKFKGTLYVPSGVTWSGTVDDRFTDATIVIEGTVNITGINPRFDGSTVYIDSAGTLNIPGDFQPNGSSVIHVLGDLDIAGFLNITGSA